MANELKRVHQVADPIEGWLSPLEGELLYRLARSCTGKGAIVEIGSYKGKSTVWLAKGSKAGPRAPVYAVDPHTGSPEYGEMPSTFDDFRRNIQSAKVADIVFPVVSLSRDAAFSFRKPVELLFIDGSHEYESVRQDFEFWAPKLLEGGTIVMHDSVHSAGPARVARDSIYTSKRFANARFVHSTTYALKTAENTPRERLKNRFWLVLKNLYGLTARLPIPVALKRAGGNILRGL